MRNTNIFIAAILMLLISGVALAQSAQAPTNVKFTVSPTSGYSPLTVCFKVSCDGGTPTLWEGYFGKNRQLPGDTTPSIVVSKKSKSVIIYYTYIGMGNYPVTFRASNSAGSAIVRQDACVQVYNAYLPKPDFMASKVSVKKQTPVTFTYTGATMGPFIPESCKWNFGDQQTATTNGSLGTTHKYKNSGVYTVSLTAINKAGQKTITKYNYITVK